MSSSIPSRPLSVLLEVLQTITSADLVVIRFGNHWFQCDAHGENGEWVKDLGRATTVTQEVGHKLIRQGEDRGKCYEMFPYLAAVYQEQQRAIDRVRSRWFDKFEIEIRGTWPQKRFTQDGILVNAHMFFSQGLAVSTAVLQFAKSFNLRIPSNRKPKRERRARKH